MLKQLTIVAISLFLFHSNLLGAEPTAQQRLVQIKQEEARATIVQIYLQKQYEAWTAECGRLANIRQSIEAEVAAEKKDKKEVKKDEPKAN